MKLFHYFSLLTVTFVSFWNNECNCFQAFEETEMQNTDDDADEPEETVLVNGNKGEEQQGTDNEGALSA
jgi:hypothetical protein